jgi:hypothetical protein
MKLTRQQVFFFLFLLALIIFYTNKFSNRSELVNNLTSNYKKCSNINKYLRFECSAKYCGGWGMK